MSRIEKKFRRLLNNPKEVKWDELLPIIKFFGLNCDKPDGGSHWMVYHDSHETNLSISVHKNRVKPIYVKKLIALIEEINDKEE